MKQLIAALSAVIAATQPAIATDRINAYLQNSVVLDAVQSTGTVVMYNPKSCADGHLGMYTVNYDAEPAIDQLDICVNNHKGNYDELTDTVRHEAWHFVQACYGGNVGSITKAMNVLGPKIVAKIEERYPPQMVAHEVEAFAVAAITKGNEQFIVDSIKKHCFK